MSTKYSDEGGEQPAGRQAGQSDDEMIEAARHYFASDFPNPQRVGCPPNEKLRAIAGSVSLPSDELRAHLFSCSNCFAEYLEAVAFRAKPVPAGSAARFGGVSFNRKAVLAFAAVIVLAALSGLIVIALRQRAVTPPPMVAGREGDAASSSNEQAGSGSKQPEQPGAFAAVTVEPQGSRSKQSAGKKNAAAQLASNYQEIDLESYSRYRGTADQGASADKAIQLKASLNQLLFRLPEGSPLGRYRVTIENSRMDQTMVNGQVPASDGKTLKATLDLRKLEAAQYVLCISPEGPAPFCYDVVVAH